MAGMKIVTVSTDAKGNVNMAELKEKVRVVCVLDGACCAVVAPVLFLLLCRACIQVVMCY